MKKGSENRQAPPDPKPYPHFILIAAGLAGFCTMAYEVLWFRVLKYFVDNSIHSFGIVLITFLAGLAVGGFLIARFIDARKDKFLFLAVIEIAIGLLCLISIPVIAHLGPLIQGCEDKLGGSWGAEVAVRFLVFSLVMLPPVALIGGAFPLLSKLYAGGSKTPAKAVGELYAVNTIGGVLGSFAGGFMLVPLAGVQGGIVITASVNLLIGVLAVIVGSPKTKFFRGAVAASAILTAASVFTALPSNAFLHVYDSRYPAPANDLLYCKENINGTTAVFQDANNQRRRFLLIDGTGEVSTDYYSMRAFRFLSTLPALYSPELKNALIVTFGSGIVAGSIAGLPGVEHEECVEICKQAFEASRFFSSVNHDAADNPKIKKLVNDGRNYVLTTDKRYDVISADATHPTSSDSWILYTKEFYSLCAKKLTDRGIMCQWIPLHGILEEDYKTILATFHAAFPYVAVYYSGGRKNIGHTMLLGSRSPLTIDYAHANELFKDPQLKADLEAVNIYSPYDLFNGFIMDQDSIPVYIGNAPVNTDDLPRIIFSKFKLEGQPFMCVGQITHHRASVFSHLSNIDKDSIDLVRNTVERNSAAMMNTIEGQVIEFREYMMRVGQKFDERNKEAILKNLAASKALYEEFLPKYNAALQLNPADFNNKYLLLQGSNEYEYLNSFIDALEGRRRPPPDEGASMPEPGPGTGGEGVPPGFPQ
jgi:spermidine synthase